MVRLFCLFLLFIDLTVVENKGSSHSGHSGHSGHVSHGSNHFRHMGENVQKRLSSLKDKLQSAISSIKEKASGNEQTPQEVSAYLQKGAESGLFKVLRKTVTDIIDSFQKPSSVSDVGESINVDSHVDSNNDTNNDVYESGYFYYYYYYNESSEDYDKNCTITENHSIENNNSSHKAPL